MPTERFYHLSEKKKTLIREAAIKEFCRVPVEKASINKIVQNAEISRGSFYTYFEDKEDLLWYVFEEFVGEIRNFCRKSLIDSGGDFWTLMPAFFDYVLKICGENQMFSLAQTASGHETLIKLMEAQADGEWGVSAEERWVNELYEATDVEHLRINSKEDYQLLFSVALHAMLASVADVCKKEKSEEEARRCYEKRLSFIRYGAECQPGEAGEKCEKTGRKSMASA